jgi:hypothetical protein
MGRVAPILYVLDFALSVASGVLASWLGGELWVHAHAWSHGVPLEDLSEDYYMGMVGLLIQIVTLPAVAILTFLVQVKRRHDRAHRDS